MYHHFLPASPRTAGIRDRLPKSYKKLRASHEPVLSVAELEKFSGFSRHDPVKEFGTAKRNRDPGGRLSRTAADILALFWRRPAAGGRNRDVPF